MTFSPDADGAPDQGAPDDRTPVPHSDVDPASTVVETTVEFDHSIEAVRQALSDPELLSAWLGEWRQHDGATTVVTDDGIRRRVTDHRSTSDGVSWRWSSDDGSTTSSVTITLEPLGDTTRLTVREVAAVAASRRGPSAAELCPTQVVLDGAAWLASLLALGAVLAASTLVRV